MDYTVEKCIYHVKRLREMRYALLYQRPFGRKGSAHAVFTWPETSLQIIEFYNLEILQNKKVNIFGYLFSEYEKMFLKTEEVHKFRCFSEY